MRALLLLSLLGLPALAGCTSGADASSSMDRFRQDLGPGGDARMLEVRFYAHLEGIDSHVVVLLHLLGADAWRVEAADVRSYRGDEAHTIGKVEGRIWMTCEPEELGSFHEEPGHPDRSRTVPNEVGRCQGLEAVEEVDALLAPLLGEDHDDTVYSTFQLAVRALAMDAEVFEEDGDLRVRTAFENETQEGALVLEDGRVRSMHFAAQEDSIRATLDYTVHYGERRPA